MEQARKLPIGIQSFEVLRTQGYLCVDKTAWILLFIFPVIFLTACQTGNSIQRQMQGIQSELFYELTTPVYLENIGKTIYLDTIDDSATPPYTTVKRKGGVIIPLLFFNFGKDNYEVTLGEKSLIQPYSDFLADALLAECNRSSCFNLKVKNGDLLPDSALILEIKVNKNITTSKMISSGGVFLFPMNGVFSIDFSNWEVKPSVSWVDISARLMQEGNCLWEKTYSDTQDLYGRKGIEKSEKAYETCIDDMTECLSYTTKGIVENISQNLHLLMLQK